MFLCRKYLPLLFLICLSSCTNTYRILHLNPDGSGNLECQIDFKRATEKQKARLKAFMNKKNSSTPFDMDKLSESFPEPYFKILKKEENRETMEITLKVSFTDINRLLAVDDTRSTFIPSDFDFSVEEAGLRIQKKLKASPDEPDFKSARPYNHLRVINTKTKEEIEMEWEDIPREKEILLTQFLPYADHRIKRKVIKRNFASYPVIDNHQVEVSEMLWRHRKDRFNRDSILELELDIQLPERKTYSYIRWSEPIMMYGRYTDGDALQVAKRFSQNSSEVTNRYGKLGSLGMDLELLMPSSPALATESSVLRLHMTRSAKTKRVHLGTLSEKANFESAGMKVLINEMKGKELSLKIEGDASLVSAVLIKSKRGNFFKLDKGSWSILENSASFSFREFIPLEGAEMYFDIYDAVEHIYMDVHLPKLDLQPRVAESESSMSWQDNIRANFSEYVRVELPGLKELDMNNEPAMQSYIEALEDKNLMTAFVQICLCLEAAESAGNRVHNAFVNAIRLKPEYREKNWQQWLLLTHQLLSWIPDDLEYSLRYLASNLGFERATREEAMRYIQEGRLNFLEEKYLPGELADSEYAQFKTLYEKSEGWMKSNPVLEFMVEHRPDFDMGYLRKLLFDESIEDLIRVKAMNLLLRNDDSFSTSELIPLFESKEFRSHLPSQLQQWMDNSQGEEKTAIVRKKLKVLETIFQDLSDLDDYQGEVSKSICEKIRGVE